jgi:hypothetical protein
VSKRVLAAASFGFSDTGTVPAHGRERHMGGLRVSECSSCSNWSFIYTSKRVSFAEYMLTSGRQLANFLASTLNKGKEVERDFAMGATRSWNLAGKFL